MIVKRDKRDQVERDLHHTIKRDQIEQIGRDHNLTISGKDAVQISGSQSLSVQGDVTEQFQGNHSEQVTQNYYLSAMQVVIEASLGLTIKAGSNFITINPAGIQISGMPMVTINSGGSPLTGMAGNLVSPGDPTEPDIADNADPGSKEPTFRTQRADLPPAQASVVDAPSHDPTSEENKNKKSWIEIELVDEDNNPVPGEKYRVTLPDGTTIAEGALDEKGRARVQGIDPGNCKVTFPNLDKTTWQPKG